MKKSGFTLSEILIALAVVGVIASVTIPSLVANTQRQHAGAALLKAINALETTNKLALQDLNVRTLEEASLVTTNGATRNRYMGDQGVLNRFMNLQPTPRNGRNYVNFNLGGNVVAIPANGFTSSDGITYYQIGLRTARNKMDLPPALQGDYFDVAIDTNGINRGPNALGRDLYRVYVDTKGTVIARGSFAAITYDGNPGALPDWENGGCDENGVGNALSCSGSIVDNGRIIHRF